MANWRKFIDRNYLYAEDLDGHDTIVTIEKVDGGVVKGASGETKKPIATLKGVAKKLALNSTNCKTIASIAGSEDVDDWVGVRVTLYPTVTEYAGQQTSCIRIRPTAPKAEGK
jgi:hypothetical protein